MSSRVNLGVTISCPSNLNFSYAPSYVIDNTGLAAWDWINGLKRWFIPNFASSQDKKISEYFISFFRGFFENEAPVDTENVKSMLSLAEKHIARHRGWFFWEQVSSDISRLEHYTLVARQRLNTFDFAQSQQVLIDKCRFDNKAAFSRWIRAGFSEDAFWAHPDLVDFIFRTYLHRHITHPYYKHTIDMQNCLVRWDGQIKMVKEPHLRFNGRQTPWSEIRKKIGVNSQSRIYSKEAGEKKRWTYLENGLIPLNEDHFATPQPLRKLDHAPNSCKIQVITTHAHKEDWTFLDRVLKGSRHSFFRIIPGEGFSIRHPEMRLEQGSVYSFGWGTIWHEFDFFSPLSTLKGKWYSPDDWEFLKQDHCITTLDVTDAQLIKLMEVIRRRSKEELPFHFITANCCGITAEVLSEAGILDLCTKSHMAKLGYEFFIPKSIRIPLDKIVCFFSSIAPECITKAAYNIGTLFHSIVFVPLFILLGAWRTKISYEDEKGIRAMASNRIKALFSNVFDFFRPSKMEFDMTKNIYKWQKHQDQIVYEKHD